MSGNDNAFFLRVQRAYANFVVQKPVFVLSVLLALGRFYGWGASKLTINSNQLDLISKDFIEVKDVKRVIDMVGGVPGLSPRR